MKTLKIWLVVIGIAGTAAVAWYLNRAQPIPVAVAEVQRGRIESTVANTRAGTVNACRRARMSPSAGGQIAELRVKEGNQVSSDQVLVELWNKDIRAKVTLAQRETEAARARAEQACVTAEVAQHEAERMTKLGRQGLTSEDQTERAVGEAKSKLAACQAARNAILVADAQKSVAEAELERTILRAPFDGTIAEINGELGEFVTPSPIGVATVPTVDLIDNRCLYISAPIDEVDAPSVRAGMRARITLDAFPDNSFDGSVRRVAPYVLDLEKQARTVEIEAEIGQPAEANLLPGYSADVEVIINVAENVLRVPTQALLEDKKVLVLDESAGTLVARDVETGLRNWEYTQILTGVQAGEFVVTSIDREGVVDGASAERE
ncbi:MAG: efflux RND transporter periplasmic adaptor subunit [Gammaproteobacteria bacterium]|nr:efflux RND transporter periplasmic adaptor subunit [Gammaproteobacteria bacterium]